MRGEPASTRWCWPPGTSLDVLHGRATGAQSERFFGAVLTARGRPGLGDARLREGSARLEQIRSASDVRAWEEHESPVRAGRRRSCATGGAARPRRDRGDDAVRVRGRDRQGRCPPRGSTSATPGHRRLPHDQGRARAGPDAPRQRDHGARAPRGVRVAARGHDAGARLARCAAEAHRAARHDGRRARALRRRRRLPPRHHAAAAAAAGRRGADRRRRAASTATPATSRAPASSARRPPTASAQVWDVVRRAQEAAFEAARPGVEAQAVDAAARRVIEDGGLRPRLQVLHPSRRPRHRHGRPRVDVPRARQHARSCGRACASATSPGSTSRARWASATRTSSSSPRDGRREHDEVDGHARRSRRSSRRPWRPRCPHRAEAGGRLIKSSMTRPTSAGAIFSIRCRWLLRGVGIHSLYPDAPRTCMRARPLSDSVQ